MAITVVESMPQDGDYSYRSVAIGWRLQILSFASYGGCQVKRVGVLEGYDVCHCLGAIYCFTAFMHIIYKLLVARRHARALKFPG